MCGILGTLPATDAVFFKKSLDRLIHRGPDSYGMWSDESNISIGHRRLAILDLSQNAGQPFFDVTKRYSIVYNGEIYNFIEIKNELEKKGYRFQSESDTEILLYAFIEWGENCLLRFNGMWAFAIWDSQKKELFMARDRFGKKPLFYASINGKFVFASEMKAIIPFHTNVRPSANFRWMAENVFLYESTEHTLIEGIKRFPHGHYGYFRNNKLTCTRYWNTLDHLIKVPEKYEDQVQEFRELFIDACRIRMRSDVPVGTALSGGLDSSATISIMAHIAKSNPENRVSSDWQHAFVATFPGTLLDESYYAEKVVENIGIEATYLKMDIHKAINQIEKYLYYFEEIYLTSPIPMIQLYGTIRELGTVVTLDGHGADELFSGYGGSLFEAMPDTLFKKEGRKAIFDAYRGLIPESIQTNKARNSFIEYADYYLRRKIDKFKGRIPESIDRNHPNFKKLDNFNKHLYIMSHQTILPTLLRNYDRYAMANGVEIRMPFMDYRVVNFAMSLNWKSKIRNGFTKSIIRDAIRPYVPDEIVNRKTKIGFNTPIVDWMKKEMREYFLDIIHSSGFKTCELIDSNKVKKQVENVIFNHHAKYFDGELAWKNLMPYLWENALLKKQ